MRTVFFACVAFALSALAPLSAHATTSEAEQTIPVWQPDADTEIRYDIFRKGKPFGTHVTTFDVDADGAFDVSHTIELRAKIGPVTVYRYSHEGRESWKGSQLISMSGATRKNSDRLSVSARFDGDVIKVEGTNYTGAVNADIVPATHWNIRQMFEGGILSTEGGQTLDVVVEELGRETLTIAGERVDATKFSLASDLTVLLWYDDEGRWVKCEFTARGQEITYELQGLY